MRCSSGCAITRAPGGADDSLTAWQDQTSDIRRRSAIASPIRANSTRPQRVARSGQDHTSPARTPQAAVAGRLNPARLLADQRADAGAHPGRITRRVDGGSAASRRAGRMGRRTSSPPQFGQTPCRTFSAQLRHQVHSYVQMSTSGDAGSRSRSQHSQFGRSSST